MFTQTARSLLYSAAAHVVAILLVIVLGTRVYVESHLTPRLTPDTYRTIYLPQRKALRHSVSGGANRAVTPVRLGVPFMAPVIRVRPKLLNPVTLDVDLPTMVSAVTGDPLGQLGFNSLGTGGLQGIGDHGCCQGVGPGHGGPGADSGASHSITAPALLYRTDPDFSDEARKAKLQGTVILLIVIDESGHPGQFKVLASPGLGLDQKAIEAVSKWRFRPAYRDGKPFATTARVEVNFHLM